jgi:secernin
MNPMKNLVFSLSGFYLILSSLCSYSQSCDTWVALGNSTSDQSVIMGKNSDRPSVEAQPFVYHPRMHHEPGEKVMCTHIEIPQVEETYAHMGSKIWWTFGYEHGLNEWGVAIGNEAEGSKVPAQEIGLLGMDLVRLALERGKTAYEAMHVITDLLQEYGQGGGCEYAGQWDEYTTYHNSFILADPGEAWVLETAGKYWVAKKVEDVWAISNSYSIESEFDEAHPELISHAVDQGWCKSREDFSFAYCYTDPSRDYSSSQNRASSNLKKLREHKGEITVDFMMNEISRNHNEGTIEAPKWSNNDNWFATTCMHDNAKRKYRTAASMVVHLRKEMPSLLRQVYWGSFSTPCVNVFKPFYFTGQAVPERYGLGTNQYSGDSPWWVAEKMKRLCDLNYKEFAPVARGVFSETENWELDRSRTMESEIVGLLDAGKRNEAEQLLEDFSVQCCLRTEKDYRFLQRTLQDMIPEVGIDFIWIEFLRENNEINDLSLVGL